MVDTRKSTAEDQPAAAPADGDRDGVRDCADVGAEKGLNW